MVAAPACLLLGAILASTNVHKVSRQNCVISFCNKFRLELCYLIFSSHDHTDDDLVSLQYVFLSSLLFLSLSAAVIILPYLKTIHTINIKSLVII